MPGIKTTFDECFQTFPAIKPPNDLNEFWQKALNELKKVPVEGRQKMILSKSLGRESQMEVSFNSYGRHRLRGILTIPRRKGKTPVIVSFHDYHRMPETSREYTDLGLAHLALGLRGHDGQVSDRPEQEKPRLIENSGLENLQASFAFACYMDAVRCIDFLRLQKGIDSLKIGLVGSGLGAAMAVFAAYQKRENVAAVAMERPALVWIPQWLQEAASDCATETRNLMKHSPKGRSKIRKNLDYLDILNWSEEIKSPFLAVVRMEDEANPPRPAFAFFNHLRTDKTMELFTETADDPEGLEQRKKSIKFLASILTSPGDVDEGQSVSI